MKSSNQLSKFSQAFLRILLIMAFCPNIGLTEDLESVYIERKPDGTTVVSDILIDSSDGSVTGVPQSIVTNSAGVPTGESVSTAGANQAPYSTGVFWNCLLAGTGTADATFIDPEGDAFTVTWAPQMGDESHVWGITCTSGDCHTINFNHDKTDGVTIWPTACDSNSNCYTHLTWCTVY